MRTGETVSGQEIVYFKTLKSMYDNDCIEAHTDDGKCYRVEVNEILKLVNDADFEIDKKKKHEYLVVKQTI